MRLATSLQRARRAIEPLSQDSRRREARGRRQRRPAAAAAAAAASRRDTKPPSGGTKGTKQEEKAHLAGQKPSARPVSLPPFLPTSPSLSLSVFCVSCLLSSVFCLLSSSSLLVVCSSLFCPRWTLVQVARWPRLPHHHQHPRWPLACNQPGLGDVSPQFSPLCPLVRLAATHSRSAVRGGR